MPAKKHKPEEIFGKLRETEIMLSQGGTTAEPCRRIGVVEQPYYRWGKEYSGLETDQARRLKDQMSDRPRGGRPRPAFGFSKPAPRSSSFSPSGPENVAARARKTVSNSAEAMQSGVRRLAFRNGARTN